MLGKNMTFRGGARIGMFNASWPFARLTLTKDSVLLKVFATEYRLKREEICRFEFFRGWFSSGVMLVHTNSTLDSHVVFWSLSPQEVLSASQELGFEIRDKEIAQQGARANAHSCPISFDK
jgi:hypothetical protein